MWSTRLISIESQPKKSCFVVVFVMKVLVVCIINFLVVVNIDIIGLVVLVLYIVVLGPRNLTLGFGIKSGQF